jgi:hypothetical protein
MPRSDADVLPIPVRCRSCVGVGEIPAKFLREPSARRAAVQFKVRPSKPALTTRQRDARYRWSNYKLAPRLIRVRAEYGGQRLYRCVVAQEQFRGDVRGSIVFLCAELEKVFVDSVS